MLESALSLTATEPRTTAEGLSAYRATVSAVRLFLDFLRDPQEDREEKADALLEMLSAPFAPKVFFGRNRLQELVELLLVGVCRVQAM